MTLKMRRKCCLGKVPSSQTSSIKLQEYLSHSCRFTIFSTPPFIIISSSSSSSSSYQRLHARVMYEMKDLRKLDNFFIWEHRLKTDDSYSTTTQRLSSQTNKKPKRELSKQKRQILIFKCLKQIPKKKFAKSGEIELVK